MGEKPPTTWEEWERAALTSGADHPEGRVEFWETRPYLDGVSRAIGMWMRGLIERRGGPHERGPYYLTPAGRAALSKETDQ